MADRLAAVPRCNWMMVNSTVVRRHVARRRVFELWQRHLSIKLAVIVCAAHVLSDVLLLLLLLFDPGFFCGFGATAA